MRVRFELEDGCSVSVEDMASQINAARERIRKLEKKTSKRRFRTSLSVDYPDEPITVSRSTASNQMHTIPVQPEHRVATARAPLVLDQERVATIMEDTNHAARVLHEALSEEEGYECERHDTTTGAATDASDRPAGLDAKPRRLLEELMEHASWSPKEFDNLARRCGLMSDGALETINEWAFHRWDEMLIVEDADGRVALNPELAADLRSVPTSTGNSDTRATVATVPTTTDASSRPAATLSASIATDPELPLPVTNEELFARLPAERQQAIRRMMARAVPKRARSDT